MFGKGFSGSVAGWRRVGSDWGGVCGFGSVGEEWVEWEVWKGFKVLHYEEGHLTFLAAGVKLPLSNSWTPENVPS